MLIRINSYLLGTVVQCCLWLQEQGHPSPLDTAQMLDRGPSSAHSVPVLLSEIIHH